LESARTVRDKEREIRRLARQNPRGHDSGCRDAGQAGRSGKTGGSTRQWGERKEEGGEDGGKRETGKYLPLLWGGPGRRRRA